MTKRVAFHQRDSKLVTRLTNPRANHSFSTFFLGIIGIIENLLASASCFTNRWTPSFLMNLSPKLSLSKHPPKDSASSQIFSKHVGPLDAFDLASNDSCDR